MPYTLQSVAYLASNQYARDKIKRLRCGYFTLECILRVQINGVKVTVARQKMNKIGMHLGLVALVLVSLAVGTLAFLNIYTKHDSKQVEVISLDGVKAERAISMLDDLGLEAVVMDTVYKDGAKKLAVINQNPAAGQMVKKGRKVYLVVNTDKVPMVMVPDLAEKTSLPQARNILLRSHLRVGNIIRQIDASVRSKNDEPVLAQYEAGTTTPIPSGTLIERNSTIDLVIGIPADYYKTDSTSTIPIQEENP
jgi:beta-lactam-binding protein with PASTA domain